MISFIWLMPGADTRSGTGVVLGRGFRLHSGDYAKQGADVLGSTNWVSNDNEQYHMDILCVPWWTIQTWNLAWCILSACNTGYEQKHTRNSQSDLIRILIWSVWLCLFLFYFICFWNFLCDCLHVKNTTSWTLSNLSTQPIIFFFLLLYCTMSWRLYLYISTSSGSSIHVSVITCLMKHDLIEYLLVQCLSKSGCSWDTEDYFSRFITLESLRLVRRTWVTDTGR